MKKSRLRSETQRVQMADATSSGSGSSGHSESRRRIHRRTHADLNPSSSNSGAEHEECSPNWKPSKQNLGKPLFRLQDVRIRAHSCGFHEIHI